MSRFWKNPTGWPRPHPAWPTLNEEAEDLAQIYDWLRPNLISVRKAADQRLALLSESNRLTAEVAQFLASVRAA